MGTRRHHRATPTPPPEPYPDLDGLAGQIALRVAVTAARGALAHLLAAALAVGQTVQDAAAAAGVFAKTAHCRLADPTFAARVQGIRDGLVSSAAGRLSAGTTAAADVLLALLAHDDATERLRAAGQILGTGPKVVEVAELQKRLEALEEQAREQQGDTSCGG